MTLADQVGRLLVEARGRRARRAVAAAAGVAPNTLRELELGEANPTVRRLEEVARHYGVGLRLVAEPLETDDAPGGGVAPLEEALG